MKYTQQTLVALFAFLLIGLTACGPEKDPELINTMVAEADSVQAEMDAAANAKQRIGTIIMALQRLNPAQRDTLKEKLAAYDLKVQDVLNAFRNTSFPEADSLASFRQAIADYENGLLKKKQAQEKLDMFLQAVSSVKEKSATLNEKVASVESELANVLPTDGNTPILLSPSAIGGAGQPSASPSVTGGTPSGSGVPTSGTSPSSTSPSQTAPTSTSPSQTVPTSTTPQKKQ